MSYANAMYAERYLNGTGAGFLGFASDEFANASSSLPSGWLVLTTASSAVSTNLVVAAVAVMPRSLPVETHVRRQVSNRTTVVDVESAALVANELRSNFGSSLDLVARVLGMGRSGVYKWYSGATPHPSTWTRLKALQEFSREWKAGGLPPLHHHWNTRIAAMGNRRVGELLQMTPLDGAMLSSIAAALGGPSSRKTRLGFPNRKRRLRDRLERLGSDAPVSSTEPE